ncbi:hypothetical protein HDV04_001444 [Boothiomyces sp. JEL0838]|nr:hypothetical protein HDV04_001444 [Boothiomyces sp. JEL0838]
MKATAARALDNLHGFITTALEVDANSQLESWIGKKLITPSASLRSTNEPDAKLGIEYGNLPRDAAFCIVKYINHSRETASLALVLLDNCAKNCGSKEFLNLLVRRFPETAKHVSHTQQKILELIGEWNYIYAQKSRYKDDFKHINDMYRLLEYKGYRFPRLNEAALNFEPDVNLKTEEQLEEEDRKNQGTKLEALIRKGTPAALAEANEMMKVMSGYDTSKKPDYKKEVSSELDRIESKVILLNDMLNQRTPEDFRMKSDATTEELYNSAKTAQTKLQKFIEENDDEDRLGRLLEMNGTFALTLDLINIVVQKYNDLKKGKAVQKNDFDRKEPSQGSKPAEKGAINLIDFDDFGSLPPANSSSNPQDDVLGGIASLNFGAPVHNQFGQPNQFTQQTQFTPPVNQFAAPQQYMQQQPNQFVQPQLNQFNQPQLTGQGQFTPQQMPLNTQMSGGFDAFSGFGSQKPVSQTQPQQQKAASPFDDLLSMNDLKPAQNNSAPTQKNDLLGLFDYVIFDKNGLQIKLQLPTPTAVPSIKAKAIFVNVTPVQFTGLSFQVALPKTMTVEMEPISSAVLAPLNQSPAAQVINIANPSKEPLRMRFKVQYAVNGAIVNENGEYALTV